MTHCNRCTSIKQVGNYFAVEKRQVTLAAKKLAHACSRISAWYISPIIYDGYFIIDKDVNFSWNMSNNDRVPPWKSEASHVFILQSCIWYSRWEKLALYWHRTSNSATSLLFLNSFFSFIRSSYHKIFLLYLTPKGYRNERFVFIICISILPIFTFLVINLTCLFLCIFFRGRRF